MSFFNPTFDRVTRFEVIDISETNDPDKRAFVKWDCDISLHIQDDGRTLKVFVYDKKELDR